MLAYRYVTGAGDAAFCHKVTAALAGGWSVVKEVDAAYDPAMKLADL